MADAEKGSLSVTGHCPAFDCVCRIPWSKGCVDSGQVTLRPIVAEPSPSSTFFQVPSFTHPAYCFGFGYLLSQAALRSAVAASFSPAFTGAAYFHLDDIVLTTRLLPDAAKRHRPDLFAYQTPASCGAAAIVTAGFERVEELKDFWTTCAELNV